MKHIQRVDELKSSTYKSAADKLAALGHKNRAAKINRWSTKMDKKKAHSKLLEVYKNVPNIQVVYNEENTYKPHGYEEVIITGKPLLIFNIDQMSEYFNPEWCDVNDKEGETIYFTFYVNLIPLDFEEAYEHFEEILWGSTIAVQEWLVPIKINDLSSTLEKVKIDAHPDFDILIKNAKLKDRKSAYRLKKLVTDVLSDNIDYDYFNAWTYTVDTTKNTHDELVQLIFNDCKWTTELGVHIEDIAAKVAEVKTNELYTTTGNDDRTLSKLESYSKIKKFEELNIGTYNSAAWGFERHKQPDRQKNAKDMVYKKLLGELKKYGIFDVTFKREGFKHYKTKEWIEPEEHSAKCVMFMYQDEGILEELDWYVDQRENVWLCIHLSMIPIEEKDRQRLKEIYNYDVSFSPVITYQMKLENSNGKWEWDGNIVPTGDFNEELVINIDRRIANSVRKIFTNKLFNKKGDFPAWAERKKKKDGTWVTGRTIYHEIKDDFIDKIPGITMESLQKQVSKLTTNHFYTD